MGIGIASLGLATVSTAASPMSLAPQVTTALGAGAVADFPTSASHSFEQPVSIPLAGGGGLTGPWSFTADAKVASENAAVVGGATVDGVKIAAVRKGASFTTSFTFPSAGAWRLTMDTARGAVGPAWKDRSLRVLVGSTEILETDAGVAGDLTTVKTRPFLVGAGQLTQTITIESATPSSGWALFDVVGLEPLSLWSAGGSWSSGVVPTLGNEVVIPLGVEVVLDSSAAAGKVHVDGGELLVADAVASLSTRALLIDGGRARFEVGLERTPVQTDFDLLLVGNVANQVEFSFFAGPGTKFLGAKDGGTIDMHGLPKTSWTKVSSEILGQPNSITVDDLDGWVVGDQIVIAGSKNQGEVDLPVATPGNDEAETSTILAISGNTLTLAAALGELHPGEVTSKTVTFVPGGSSETVNIDQRPEVGMLSHNVTVRGVLGSNARFGGHVVLFRGDAQADVGGRGRFSAVEFSDVGQLNELGRYPIHWHMQRDHGLGQYMLHSSIHHSFNRVATIHGTEYVRFEGNVAFDHIGHGVFLEDGSERFNEIHDNLVMTTRRPAENMGLLPTDASHAERQNRSPASFWITNPRNYLTGNVAAGTAGTGYWYALPDFLLGKSNTQPYFAAHPLENFGPIPVPLLEKLGTFEDNVAHSCGIGLDINDSINADRLNPEDTSAHTLSESADWVPSEQATFLRFVGWGCRTGIYTGESHGDQVFESAVLADNYFNVDFAGYQEMLTSYILADTGTGVYPANSDGVAYTIYHNGKMTNTVVEGFSSSNKSVFTNRNSPQKQTNHVFNGVRLVPQASWIDVRDYSTGVDSTIDPTFWTISIRDVDGGITPNPRETIISGHPMMRVGTFDSPIPYVIYTGAGELYSSPFKFGHVRIQHLNHDGIPVYTLRPDFLVRRFDLVNGTPSIRFDYNLGVNINTTNARRQFPLIVDALPAGGIDQFDYEFEWRNYTDKLPSIDNRIEVVVDDVAPSDVTTFAFKIDTQRTVIAETKDPFLGGQTPVTLVQATDLMDLNNEPNSNIYHDAVNGIIYFRFVNVTHEEGSAILVHWDD